jgi:hypothetical protein
VHDTFQRCIVVHSTFNLRVIDNFAYRGYVRRGKKRGRQEGKEKGSISNRVGQCFYIESGNEEHNLGIKGKKERETRGKRK